MKKLALYIVGILLLAGGIKTNAQVAVEITIAPPVLPVYIQPDCPVEGYLWSPGYWAWGDDGYYWVPGTWVLPPMVGYLWTPGYWGFWGGRYLWHGGYWGPHIGFYGGINYGFGYYGSGFCGGRWEGGAFRYNSAVWSVNRTIVHNTYEDRTVIVNNTNHTGFNGQGGVSIAPTHEEQSAMNEKHFQPTSVQQSNEYSASKNRNQLAKVNGGHPSATAVGPSAGQRNAFNRNSTHNTSNTNNTHVSSGRQQPRMGGFNQSHATQPQQHNSNMGGQQMRNNNMRQSGGQRQLRNSGGGGQRQQYKSSGGGQQRMNSGGGSAHTGRR
jgi:hypothetical protein